MGKRPVEEAADGNQAYLKRQKIVQSTPVASPPDDIRSGRQLRQILAFDQDAGRSKHAILSFKNFLDAFSLPESDNTSRKAILKDYLDSQSPIEDDETTAYLSDLMQTWSFASQSNNESLLSAVPAVLALLFRTMSSILEFADHGIRLGKTLLQKRQLELIVRGLRANKSREFVISPVLRLLKELSTFNGGSLAKQVFRARDQTFQNLPRNLNLRYNGNESEDRKRPSVRTNAIRFVLSLFKFLPAETKREFLNSRDVVSAITKDIKDDPPFIVRDILETLKSSVLQDDNLPRDAKTRIINASLLSRVAMLYRYDQHDDETSTSKQSVDSLAHEFLLIACTSPSIGVLNWQAGFYPRGVDPEEVNDAGIDQDVIDLGLDSIDWLNKFTDKVPIRNTILSEFIQNLRPWSSTKQSDLLLSIFKAAPELVAEYFYHRRTFPFDPKLTATWIGYSAFIFSAIQLPIPEYFGHQERYARLPPPVAIVLENILPQPLTQKVLRTCLLQDQKLISFFAVRLLCNAFAKLKSALKMYEEAATGQSPIWTQAADRLATEFCQRCPSMKDVIFAFRKTAESDVLQREAFTRLLILYYEVTPRLALDAKFDVSEALSKTLLALDDLASSDERAMRVMELENLFQFAQFSPGMRWFSKLKDSPFSPFTTMLRITAKAALHTSVLKLKPVLAGVIAENQVLQSHTTISSLDAFILSLQFLQSASENLAVYSFIDDCASRCAAKPVKYIFALEEIQSEISKSTEQTPPVSLLILAIREQWPFIVKSTSEAELHDVARFLAQYLARSIKIGEDKKVIEAVAKELVKAAPTGSLAATALEEIKDLVDSIVVPEAIADSEGDRKVSKSKKPSEEETAIITSALLDTSQSKTDDHSPLTKWINKEVDEVIEGGHAAALVMLLSSEHFSVRKEAIINIMKFATKLKESTFEEKDQIWLLLCEVAETAKQAVDKEPLPTVIAVFASQATAVLTDPLHCLYAKINKFLSQGPTWETTKLPLMYKILDEPPTIDDAHYTEINWLLTYLLSGLQTTADLTIYRKRRVFEKLLSIYNSPYLGAGLRDKIMKILFKATTIDGGSTTLITRFSAMTWAQAQVALGAGTAMKVLMERLLESSDKKRVQKWSKGSGKDTTAETLEF